MTFYMSLLSISKGMGRHFHFMSAGRYDTLVRSLFGFDYWPDWCELYGTTYRLLIIHLLWMRKEIKYEQ